MCDRGPRRGIGQKTGSVAATYSLRSGGLWPKLDHLLYMPILGLTRPRDLYYYQGDGLRVMYGFTYKYLTQEHFLGQLTRLQVGTPLANALATDMLKLGIQERSRCIF